MQNSVRTRIGSILLAVVMLLGLLPVSALVAGGEGEPTVPGSTTTISVSSFDDLKEAQSAAEGSVIEVSGTIDMAEPVTFENPVTLKFLSGVELTYVSNNNNTVYLITVQDGSMVYFAEGASITMTGDTQNRNDSRDWRVIRSLGTLTFSQCAGSVTVTNAKGRAFYGTTDVVFCCDMAADITIDNTVGANRYVFAIYAINNVIINGNLSGSIDVDFGGGNTAAGIYAAGITVNGDITGDIDVQLGTSHAGYGLYAANDIIVTGDISGRIYARGGSFNGYGIYAETGAISIKEISGSVAGDCYNDRMANSQYKASALYAGGSIYGVEGEPLQLTGTLSSTVGRNNAFTVQATEDVSISVADGAKIIARSSYSHDANITPDGEQDPLSNNWGGAAAGVIAGGNIDITGNTNAITAVSKSENGTTVDAGFLASTGDQKSVTKISNFLYTAAAEDPATAIEASKDLTEAEKNLINGYDEIMADLYSKVALKVGTGYTYATIADAVNAAKPGDIIQIMEDQTINAMVTIDEGVTITAAEGVIITGNGKDGKPAIYLDADNAMLSGLTINFATSDENGSIAAVGMGHDNSGIVVEDCVITTGSNNRALAPYDGASLAYATTMAYTITGNTITTDSNQGAIFSANFSGEISGNTFNRVAGTTGNVWAINGTLMNNLLVEKNTFNDCGIIANGTVSISDNDFALTAQANGIVFGAYGQYGTPNLTVEDNTFTGSGIAFYFADLYGTNTGKAGTLATEFAGNDFAAGVTAVNNTVPDQVYFDEATGSVSLVTSAGAGDDLQSIIDDAEEGDVIVLSGDVVLDVPLTINTPVTINGNGHIISVSDSFSGDVITVYADDTTIQNVTVDGTNKSGYGIQFYKAENGRLKDVTAKNNTKRGINVNASTVTADGTITLSGNRWGDSINVGFGSGISDAPNASLDVTNATLVGVDSIYADAGDVERAKEAGKVITVTDGNNTYVAVGDGITPVLFVPKDTVEDTAVITVVAPDGTPTYYQNPASLKKAIENAPEGSTVTLAQDTAFSLTSAIEVTKDVTINGNGSTITANQCVGIYIKDDLKTLVVKDLTLKGTPDDDGIAGEGGSGSFMGIGTYNLCYGVEDLQLNNVTIDGFSYGLYFGSNESNDTPVSVNAEDLTIQNCYIKGAYFEKLTDSTFTNCQFIKNGADKSKVESAFQTWMCGVDVNLKYGVYEDIEFIDCTFTGNGDNSGTALHIKARDDGDTYGADPAKLDGVTVTGCTFTDNNDPDGAPIVLGEPGKNNKTPVNVYIQPDVDYVNNLDQASVVTVTFDSNGGSAVAEQIVEKDSSVTLPIPTRFGYTFQGWYVGNTKVSSPYQVTSNVTLVAQWSYIDQGGGTTTPTGDYLVNVDRTTGGKVTVNPGRADKGDTVTITVKPNDGYVLDELTVTAKDGSSVKLTWKDDNKYTFTMPGSQVSIEATFVKEGGQVVNTLPFADVAESDWYYDAVQYVYENDLMNGTSSTAFSPFVTTSRAMILTILARYDGVDTSTGSTWYEAGAVWAIAEGVSDGTNLEANLTREQLVTMLWRYAGSPVVESDLSDYPDSASVSDWAVNAMIWAVENGVITGNGAGALNPQGTATRAEVATILMRFIENNG